jgi:hypothetical protein
MADTRQAGQRKRVELFQSLVEEVRAKTRSDRDRALLIEVAVGQADYLNEKSKDTLRGQCKRVTHPRVLPVFDQALRFSERVIAERATRNPSMPTVQHALIDVCKCIIDANPIPPAQCMTDIQAAYAARGVYP